MRFLVSLAAYLLVLAPPAVAETIIGTTNIALSSGPTAISACSGLATAVDGLIPIPDGSTIARFEIELMEFASNLGAPCGITLDFPWEPESHFNHFAPTIGECPVQIGDTVVVQAGAWGYDHLMGLTSVGTREQTVDSMACFSVQGQPIEFTATLVLRAVGDSPVHQSGCTWSALRASYK